MNDTFTPTYLYVKRHKITNLHYFGKTTKLDPYKYTGSGKRWLRHIKKHGIKHVETIWVKLFLDKEELISFAKTFSTENNIVESSTWANLCIENGLDGGLRHNSVDNLKQINSKPRSLETKKKMGKSVSIALTGKKQSFTRVQKRSNSLKSRPIGTCPYCGKSGKLLGRFLGHHFDKCSKKI